MQGGSVYCRVLPLLSDNTITKVLFERGMYDIIAIGTEEENISW